MNKEVKIAVYGIPTKKLFIQKIQEFCYKKYNKYVGAYNNIDSCYIATTDYNTYKYYYIGHNDKIPGRGYDEVLIVDDALFDLQFRINDKSNFRFIATVDFNL